MPRRHCSPVGQMYRVRVTRADGAPALNEGGYTYYADAETRGRREVERLAAEGIDATFTVE